MLRELLDDAMDCVAEYGHWFTTGQTDNPIAVVRGLLLAVMLGAIVAFIAAPIIIALVEP